MQEQIEPRDNTTVKLIENSNTFIEKAIKRKAHQKIKSFSLQERISSKFNAYLY